MKKLSLIVLCILIAAQLAVPFSMIRNRENILRNGELFRFKTRPIDPADPFQGRYVWLGFDNNSVPCSKEDNEDLAYKMPIYALLETGEDGFAHFTGWSLEKPEDGHYLKTRYRGRSWNQNNKAFRIDLPFDRYYMDEAKAPRAEILVRESTRSTNCWANVRILEGKALIEDVFAEGQSLRDLAAEKE